MNYCIFSIDDSRKHYTDKIRSTLSESFWFTEKPVWTVNYNNEVDAHEAPIVHPYPVRWVGGGNVPIRPRKGQLGIWYSVLNALEYLNTPIVTFEDDAILCNNFLQIFWSVTENLPKDTDAFSLFLPRDQDQVYYDRVAELYVTLGISRAYQVYGGVSMLWTPQGAEKFKRLVSRDGIYDQWDNQLYAYARAGEMNVYTQSPDAITLVGISGTEASIVQESEFL